MPTFPMDSQKVIDVFGNPHVCAENKSEIIKQISREGLFLQDNVKLLDVQTWLFLVLKDVRCIDIKRSLDKMSWGSLNWMCESTNNVYTGCVRDAPKKSDIYKSYAGISSFKS